jgi:hypothetical protein
VRLLRELTHSSDSARCAFPRTFPLEPTADDPGRRSRPTIPDNGFCPLPRFFHVFGDSPSTLPSYAILSSISQNPSRSNASEEFYALCVFYRRHSLLCTRMAPIIYCLFIPGSSRTSPKVNAYSCSALLLSVNSKSTINCHSAFILREHFSRYFSKFPSLRAVHLPTEFCLLLLPLARLRYPNNRPNIHASATLIQIN